MRVLAGIMVLITLLVGVFFGYCYFGAQMRINGVAAQVTEATDAQGTFAEVQGQLANGSFLGRKYYEVDLLMPESFSFLTLTVRMENRGLFPMDWVQIEIAPNVADVLQLPLERTPTLAAGSAADFSTTILMRHGAETSRKVTVTYYVLGRPMTATHDMALTP